MPKDVWPQPVLARPKRHPLQALQAGLSPWGPSCWRPGPGGSPGPPGSIATCEANLRFNELPRAPLPGKAGGRGCLILRSS